MSPSLIAPSLLMQHFSEGGLEMEQQILFSILFVLALSHQTTQETPSE